MTATTTAFAALWEEWRAERDRELGEPYGILSITGIHFLTETPTRIDGVPGWWSTGVRGPLLELEPGEELQDEGGRVTRRLAFGPLAGRPPRQLRHGSVIIDVQHVAGSDFVRPRDPDHPLRLGYTTTPAYEPDERWRVSGVWHAYSEPHAIQIGSAQPQLSRIVDAPGEIEFELGGRTHRLIATPAYGVADHVALLFRDLTSGVTTYAALRELQVRLPDSGDAVELDFNRALNKNCAYTDYAICPLPPAGNELNVAVEAGEQTPFERRGAGRTPEEHAQ